MKPFVKWAGGKTQLLKNIRESMPNTFDCYYEPFVGGGAVFFDVKPLKAVISDLNEQLINAYLRIRDDVESLMNTVDDVDNKGECTNDLYYSVRERYNYLISNNINNIETAALLIWLNHHCFNGLYRTNRSGLFNTPWNRTVRYKPSYDRDNLIEISEYLKSNDIIILCNDYKEVIKMPHKGDFVFLDPPYDPVGKYGDFKRYTREQFDENDQYMLSVEVKLLYEKGIDFCLTNSNTDYVRELYSDFNIEVIQTHRNINSKGASRNGEDAIITS